MKEIADILINNGIGVGSLLFMMYFTLTAMKDNTTALNSIRETMVQIQTSLVTLTERVDKIEDKIERS